MTLPERLYWDCTCFGRHFPDGIGRFTVAMAERQYQLPSVYLLPPYLEGGPLHRLLERTPGEVRVVHRHPRRRYPWRWWWNTVLDQPGIMLAPGNFHRPVLRWPRIVIVHDLIPYLDADYLRHAHAPPRRYRRLLERADGILAISAWTAASLRRFAPAAPPARLLRQGLFAPTVAQPPEWAPRRPFYLFVGGAEPRKRLEAAVALANALADAPLVVVGRDWPGRTVRDLTGATGSRVEIVHRQEVSDLELAGLYAECRALLYPTRMEGFGLIGLEALRARRPVVAFPGSALPEVLGDFAIWCDYDGSGSERVRAALDSWREPDGLAGHLASFDWDAARDVLSDAVDGVMRG